MCAQWTQSFATLFAPSFREVSKDAYSALRPQLQGACGALRMIGLIPLNYNQREALASLDSFR